MTNEQLIRHLTDWIINSPMVAHCTAEQGDALLAKLTRAFAGVERGTLERAYAAKPRGGGPGPRASIWDTFNQEVQCKNVAIQLLMSPEPAAPVDPKHTQEGWDDC